MKIVREWPVQTLVSEENGKKVYLHELHTIEKDIPDEIETDTPYSHEHVVMDYFGTPVEIDKKLAPLMRHLWDLGIRTNYCCQGDYAKGFHTTAYIMFDGSKHADAFTALVCNAAGEASYLVWCINSGNKNEDDWEWSPSFHNGKVRWTVRFPRHHIVEIEEALGIWDKNSTNTAVTETPTATLTSGRAP
jgi:hypothetical protein